MLSQVNMNMNSVRQRSISKPTLIYNNSSNLNVILVANFKFLSENNFELSVNKGDLLKFIGKRPGGWILVKSLDKLNNCGLIPAGYVDIVINDTNNPITVEWLTTEEKGSVTSAPTTPVLQSGDTFVSPKTVQPYSSPKPVQSFQSPTSQSKPAQSFQTPKSYQPYHPPVKGSPYQPPVKGSPSTQKDIGVRDLGVKDLGASLDSVSLGKPNPNLASPEYKRSHSDTQTARPNFRARTGSEPINKLRSPANTMYSNSTSNDSRASFMNPYMKVKPQLKDFKSDSFNKFKPLNTNLTRDDGPITPISPIDAFETPRNSTALNSRSNSVASNPMTPKTPISPKSSFSLTSPLTIKPGISRNVSGTTVKKHSSKHSLKHNSKSPPTADKIPRESIGSPILTSPVTSFNASAVDDGDLIDFQADSYEPTSQLVSVSISNCLIHNDRYWYRIDLRYPHQKVLLAKFYNDFYNLHLDILDHDNLPKLPQPIELNQKDNDSISSILKRCNELNNYLNKLIKLNIPRVNEWLNFRNNPNSLILHNLAITYNENELNNKILNSSVNLLYRNLKVNLINGSAKLVLNLNKNELSNLNVLKSLVSKQISFNHLLININGKYELIDSISFDFIMSVEEIDLRIIN